MNTRRILVTGASGFIGKALIRRLCGDSSSMVSVLLRDQKGGLPAEWPDELLVVEADLRDYQAVRAAVQEAQPDLIFHLAAAGVRQPFLPLAQALDHNLQGTINLLRAAFEDQASPAKQLIVSRTPGERTAMNHYAASKAAAWLMCQMYGRTRGWPIVGAMIFQVYGPGQSKKNLIPAAIQAALQEQDLPMTEGSQQRDWIFVEDVLDGLMAMARTNLETGSTVDIGSGRLVSVAGAVRTVFDLVGGRGRPLIGALPSRPGEEKVQAADSSRTETFIGWKFSTSLEEGLRSMIAAERMSH